MARPRPSAGPSRGGQEILLPGPPSSAEHAGMVARAMREARAAARLNHPNVITIHHVVEHEGTPWIVMEFVDGSSLQDEIGEHESLSWKRVADVGTQVADALGHAPSKVPSRLLERPRLPCGPPSPPGRRPRRSRWARCEI